MALNALALKHLERTSITQERSCKKNHHQISFNERLCESNAAAMDDSRGERARQRPDAAPQPWAVGGSGMRRQLRQFRSARAG